MSQLDRLEDSLQAAESLLANCTTAEEGGSSYTNMQCPLTASRKKLLFQYLSNIRFDCNRIREIMRDFSDSVGTPH